MYNVWPFTKRKYEKAFKVVKSINIKLKRGRERPKRSNMIEKYEKCLSGGPKQGKVKVEDKYMWLTSRMESGGLVDKKISVR